MLATSARLLRLLSLLQQRRDWSGADLAERLEVTTRTIRHDVDKLRSLGYPVDATPGVAGGYRLVPGASLPPLLLDDEEAVAIALGLRTAASGSVAGLEETSVRALTKLEQVLPSRLRRRVAALQSAIVRLPGSGPGADPDVLVAIAAACRDQERLRFDYADHGGAETRREVEPYRLVHDDRRWYLVGWDTARRDWRTFRADRVRPLLPAGPRFTPRPAPDDGVERFVRRGLSTATWRYRGRVRCLAPATEVAARLPAGLTVTPVDDRSCVVEVGSDTVEMLAAYVGMLDVDFEVLEPAELADRVRALGRRYLRAADPPAADPA